MYFNMSITGLQEQIYELAPSFGQSSPGLINSELIGNIPATQCHFACGGDVI